MTRTEWYPPTTHPVRIGWYETRNRPPDAPELPGDIYMDWWDGFMFCEAGSINRLTDWTVVAYWRGLTKSGG